MSSEWRTIDTAPTEDECLCIQLWNGVSVCAGHRYESGWIDTFCDWIVPQPTMWKPLSDPPSAAHE